MPEMLKLTKSLSVVPATNTRAIFFSNKIHQNLFQKHHIVSCTLMENRPAQYGKSGYRNQGLQLYYKRGFWYSCFPVNFSIFLRIPFSVEHLCGCFCEISKVVIRYYCKFLKDLRETIIFHSAKKTTFYCKSIIF